MMNFNPNQPPFFLRSGATLTKIRPEEILYVEAFDNYSYIHFASKKILVPHTLKSIEEKLSSQFFVRSHKSFLVNLNRITHISGNYLQIANQRLRVGKVYKERLINRIEVL